MTVYIITIISSCFFAYIAGKRIANNNISQIVNIVVIKKGYYFYVFLSFLPLFVVSALRWRVGIDYDVYVEEFYKIKSAGFLEAFRVTQFECGYVLINKIVSYFTYDYAVMFAIIAFLTIWIFIVSIYKYSTIQYMSIFLYIMNFYYYQSFNQIRQMLAVSIILYSLVYIKEHKLIKFLSCIFIASLFHLSAVCFIIAYFLGNWDLNRKNMIIYISTAVGSSVLLPVIKMIASMTKFGIYLDDSFGASNIRNTIINLLVRLIVLIAALCFSQNILKLKPENKVLYNLLFIAVIFQVFTVQFLPFGRLSTYFYVFTIFLIPEVLKSLNNKYLRLFSNIITILCFVVINYMYFKNSQGFLPYQTIFDR